MNPTPILAGLLVIAVTVLGGAKLAAVPAMRSRAEHAGFSVAAYRRIGALEVLAGVGLIAGAFVPCSVPSRPRVSSCSSVGHSSSTAATATASARSPQHSSWVW